MSRAAWLCSSIVLLASAAHAQVGPGLGNLTYTPAEVFTPVGYVESPHGHGNVTLVQGYLMVIYSSDGGGNETNGGIEFWDVSNPRMPRRVYQYDDAQTHGLREAHGFSLAHYGSQLLLAAQGVTGIQIWDVTRPSALSLVTSFPVPGIARGDYSGDWWLFWQAPYVFLAGVDQGLYVIDASVPSAPVLLAQVPTGDLGGVSPAQVFVLGNLAVVMESQGGDMATLDVSDPARPRLLQQFSGRAGYSHLFAGDGKILTSGSIPPRAHFFQVTPTGDISFLDTVGFYFNSGGYGSYQDGYFHSGFSNDYRKFQISPPSEVGSGSSGRTDRDEDFATVLGNVVVAGDDHGVGTAIIPHQAAPDTTPPTVAWMHPPSGSTGLPLTSRIGLSYSDHIDAASLTEANVRLLDDTGAVVPARVSAQMGLVNLAPLTELGVLRSYRVVAENVRDVAGNVSPRFEGNFTTGDGGVAQSPTGAITNVDVNGGFGRYALGTFTAGRRTYSDRDYTFTAQYPGRLEGQAYLQTANVDRLNFRTNFLGFELLAPAEVLVLYDARASSIPNWLGGFTATGETVVNTDTTFDVYARRFPAGPVSLGGNSAPGGRGADSMYSVVIIPDPVPCAIDLTPTLTGTVTLRAMGPANGTYAWRVDGRTLSGPSPQVYLAPGRHPITLRVQDGVLGASCSGVKISHRPLVSERARPASRLVWLGGHTVSVNPDHGSVVRIDPATSARLWETTIGGEPTTLAVRGSELWVVDREGAQLVVLAADTGRELARHALPRASAPFAVVVDPAGAVFVTLEATGELVRVGADGQIAARASVAPTLRGLTWFAGRLYATRFLSPDTHGEVHVRDAATLAALPMLVLPYDRGPDTEASGRGVPNYVAEVQISPDGTRGWVASKKDNTARGSFRDGRTLTFESRVRTIVSGFDVATSSAALTARLDINDRDLVLTTLPSRYGELLFVASQSVNVIDVFDVAQGRRVSQFEVGRAPHALALDGEARRLAVLNYLSRTVSYYDVSGLLGGTSNAVVELATVPTASREVLDAVVLRGKQIFHDAADDRMSRDGYISCSSCHLDGGHDGRTWDFTQAGEGLRNTIALAGRAGTGHGRVHWTANFDELQDFENDIRLAFGGTGFLSDADFMATRDPLGPNKAGRSPELDALAVYVASLSDYPPSPHRAPDGALTEAARRGRVVFGTAGCVTCHAGATFTDGQRHDVGTISPGSGLGLGRALAGVGFDTPTLRSLWAGAPYLHDGSAADLDEALLRHGEVPVLEAAARADLVAYLLELDGTSLPPEAPCAQGPDECVGGSVVPPDAGATEDAAQSGADAATDAAVVAVDGAVSADAGVGAPDAGVVPPADAGCGCSATTAPASTSAGLWLGALALLVLARRRRR